ncbi:MAG: DUF1667 domain-containing protein [Limnochordia bacterium]|nr:DUF1667 domain-containing protein [Limnochordia bacterium]
MLKNITCTVCPMSCNIELTLGEDNEILSLTGNNCARGKVYATSEHMHPERTLTSIVKARGGVHPVLPVRTNKPIPKDMLKEGMQVAATIEAEAPIKMGDVIVPNFLGLGVDLVATRNL